MSAAGAHRILTKLVCFRGRFPMPSLDNGFLCTGADEKSMFLWQMGCGPWLIIYLLMEIEALRLPLLNMTIVTDASSTLGLWSEHTAFQWLGGRGGWWV